MWKFEVRQMKCLSNLQRLNYPADLVYKISKLYSFKGKDFYYEDVLKASLAKKIENTIAKDTINAVKLLDLKVTDNRVKLIVKSDSEPKTKDETVVANIKKVFQIIQEKGTDLELTSNEFLMLADKIFRDKKAIRYRSDKVEVRGETLLPEIKNVSMRDQMDEAIKLYKNNLVMARIEPTQVIANFYIDLLHMNCFTDYNEFIALMILYCLLVSQRFNLFKYISFFEKYDEKKVEFDGAVSSAAHDWENGFSETRNINSAIINLMLEGYQEVENMVNTKKFEKGMTKIDNVRGAIMHLPGDTFTREDIKRVAPDLSDSTINRALEALKKDGKIELMGGGRSAVWVKKTTDEVLSYANKQMSIFEFQQEN